MRARVTTRLRPIRFGVLADVTSADYVTQAVGVKTLLWGGGFNPIIPAVAAVPRIWSNEVLILDAWTPEELLDAHLFAFDPDSLVVVEGAVLHGRDLSPWRVLATNELGLVERAA